MSKPPANSGALGKRPMPVGRRFQKGVSGNPSGRPAGLAEFQDQCRGHTQEAIQALVNGLSDDVPAIRITAAKELLDRGWGKAVQPIDGDLGKMVIQIVTNVPKVPDVD